MQTTGRNSHAFEQQGHVGTGREQHQISRQQIHTHINPGIDLAADAPTYASNPEVRETYLSSQPDNSSQTPHQPKSRNGADAVLQKTIASPSTCTRFQTPKQTL
jgi:hypothetical protein